MQNLSGKLWPHHIFNNNFRKRNRHVTRSSTRGRAREDSIQNLSGQMKSLGSSRAASAGMLPLDVPVQSCNTPVLGETIQEETRCPEHWESQKYQQKEHEECSHTPPRRTDGQHFREGQEKQPTQPWPLAVSAAGSKELHRDSWGETVAGS